MTEVSEEEKVCVLVTGASGWIGRHLCEELGRRGVHVIACDLQESEGPWDSFLKLDISRDSGFPGISAVRGLATGCKDFYLIHCAGYAHRPVETADEVERFWSINAEGTKRVVDWAGEIGVNRLLYLSSIAFYDWEANKAGMPLDEEATLKGETAYAQSKLKGEHYIENADMDTRIVRLATVFGRGDRANFSKLAKALKAKRFLMPGEGSARKSVVSVEWASRWMAQFILMENPLHRTINLCFGQTPDLKTICDTFCRLCGFAKPVMMPVPLFLVLAKLGDLASIVVKGFPLTSGNLKKLTGSTWVDSSRAAQLFPEVNKITFEEALKESYDDYQDE